MIALLHKLDSTLEALRRKIGAAQDAISRLEEDIKYVQRKLGIIPYTMREWDLRKLYAPLMRVCLDVILDGSHAPDALAYGLPAFKYDKVKIVRPPEMYFGVDWARDEKNG